MRHVSYGLVSFAIALIGVAALSPAHAQRSLRVGNMWDTIEDMERGGWGGKDMTWPGGHWPRFDLKGNTIEQGTGTLHGSVIGVRNFTNLEGTVMPFALAQNANSSSRRVGYDRIMIDGALLTWQQKPPTVIVDNEELAVEDPLDFVDPDLVSDAMIELEWTNVLGVTQHLRAYAYVNRDFDDVIIRDYRLINNGQADDDRSTIEFSERDLEGFFFMVDNWFMDRGEGGSHWGHAAERRGDVITEYYGGLRGENRYEKWVETGGAEGDSLRIMFAWDGDSLLDPADDGFDPHKVTGRLLSAKIPGYGLLHADRAYNDESDWIQQPVAVIAETYGERNLTRREEYGDEIGYRLEFGFDKNPDLVVDSPWYDPSFRQLFEEGALGETLDPNANGVYGLISSMTVGPYDILPWGEDLRMVFAYAVGGMDWRRTIEVGNQYKSGVISKEEKNAIVFAYKDSLFNIVSLAKLAFGKTKLDGSPKAEFDIPDPPPAPDLTVTSGPAHIAIEWSDVSNATDRDTGVNDFMEYRLYRAQGSFWGDMPFERVYSGTDRSFIDTDVIRAFSYYYYVTAVDDGTQNWVNGKPLESGMHHNRTTRVAIPFRAPLKPGETKLSEGDLRVVPNPWDSSDLENKFGSLGSDDFNKILFVNLPARCTIRIYTEAGDLVRKLEHGVGASLPSGDEAWDQITDFNQEVVSGIYIAVIESDQGNDVVKFVIIK